MPYIQVNSEQFPLPIGDITVGTAPDAGVHLEGPDALGVQAIVQTSAAGQSVIRRASPAAVVRVNGVQLGAEPSPLIHGDKIEVAGQELLFGDDRKGGATQLITGVEIPELAAARAARAARPTATTGGRLVSLVDGREYAIPATGLVLGRDAGCDVVVPGHEVSRKHAEIVAGAEGYVVSDTSTNGVFVNGERVKQSQLLGRGDVVRIGNEEFRFYADAAGAGAGAGAASAPAPAKSATAPPAPASPAPPAPAAPAPPPAPPKPASPPPAAPAPAADARPVLATLEIINEGVNKGKRYEIRSPLTHVGRGAHNDVVINDDSVSDSHAKLQKREGGWHVVDMGSTNGTYVGGTRIEGEAPLAGATDLRFGGVKMRIHPVGADAGQGKGTRAIAGMSPEQARRLAAQGRPTAPRPAEPVSAPGAEREGGGIPLWVWLAVIVLIAAAALFILQGR